jgi:hypothetical protein
VNLATGQILQPNLEQWLRFGADVGVYYTLDGAFLVNGGIVIYVTVDQLIDGEGE